MCLFLVMIQYVSQKAAKSERLKMLLQVFQLLKAAIINIYTLITDQITLCIVEGVTRSDEPTENYHPNFAVPLSLAF